MQNPNPELSIIPTGKLVMSLSGCTLSSHIQGSIHHTSLATLACSPLVSC